MKRLLWGASALCVVASAASAFADPTDSFSSAPATIEWPRRDVATPRAAIDPRLAPPRDWRIAGYLGGFGDRDSGGITSGVAFLYRSGFVEGGALLEAGSTLLDYTYESVAATGGLTLRPSKNARLELLGLFGQHFYSSVGKDRILGNDPGIDGSAPFAGARASASYVFGRGAGHFELGAYASLEDDLTRSRVQYTYPATGTGWFDGGGTGDHVVGTYQIGFGLVLGGSHDLL